MALIKAQEALKNILVALAHACSGATVEIGAPNRPVSLPRVNEPKMYWFKGEGGTLALMVAPLKFASGDRDSFGRRKPVRWGLYAVSWQSVQGESIEVAPRWVKDALRTQDPDGYFLFTTAAPLEVI